MLRPRALHHFAPATRPATFCSPPRSVLWCVMLESPSMSCSVSRQHRLLQPWQCHGHSRAGRPPGGGDAFAQATGFAARPLCVGVSGVSCWPGWEGGGGGLGRWQGLVPGQAAATADSEWCKLHRNIRLLCLFMRPALEQGGGASPLPAHARAHAPGAACASMLPSSCPPASWPHIRSHGRSIG